jgi:hypothetical protein
MAGTDNRDPQVNVGQPEKGASQVAGGAPSPPPPVEAATPGPGATPAVAPVTRLPAPVWIEWAVPTATVILIVGAVLVWKVLPVGLTEPSDLADTLETAMDDTLLANFKDYELGYKANIIIQLVLIFTSISATVFAAITTAHTAEAMKKWSVLLTALTAACAAFLSTFHIRENLEGIVSLNTELVALEANYLADRAVVLKKLKERQWDPDTKIPEIVKAARAAKDNKTTDFSSLSWPQEILDLQFRYSKEYARLQAQRMKLWMNVGSQSLPPAATHPAGALPTPPTTTMTPTPTPALTTTPAPTASAAVTPTPAPTPTAEPTPSPTNTTK